MTALTLAFSLALAGSAGFAGPALGEGPGPDPAAPTAVGGIGGAPLADGVYALDMWYPARGQSQPFAYPVSLHLVGGVVQVFWPCLPYGQGSYQSALDGRWSFDPGTMASACPGGGSTEELALAMVAMGQATTWSVQPDPNRSDPPLVLAGPEGKLSLTAIRNPGPASVAPPDYPGSAIGPRGVWRVESITSSQTNTQESFGPYSWTVDILTDWIFFPPGCNTPSGTGYTATASGAWRMESPRAFTLVGCPGEREESETLFHSLAAATQWAAPDPNTLVVSGNGVQVVLARPALTNRAFDVAALAPGTRTVRLGVGETATVPITASPLSPKAIGRAPVAWKNSRTAVAAVTATGKASAVKKAASTGTVQVPMNTGGTATLAITAKARGTSRVTFTAASGVTTSIKVVVVAKPKPAKTVTITKTSLPGMEGTIALEPTGDGPIATLKASVRPAKATGAVPRWTSSDPGIVQVDADGTVRVAGKWAEFLHPVTITVTAGAATATYQLTLP